MIYPSARGAIAAAGKTGGGGGGAWTPLDLGAKLIGYWDTKASGITQSGGTVSQINDLSGNSRHLVQATSGLRPAYNATGFGASKPSLDFDGVDDFMLATGITLGGNKCACAMIGMLSTGSPEWASFVSITDTAMAAPLTFFQEFQNELVMMTQRNNQNRSIGGAVAGFDTRFRMLSQFNSVNNVLTIDGVDQTVVADTASFDATVSLSLGARTNGGQVVKGKAGMVFLLNDVMTSGEKTSFDTWATAW